MYLKEIVTNGFKSFADKMEIKLDDEVTCIVGPNGSGKSNIVDAIRWVLGEQSVKNLRGDGGMSDVIFAGSESRKAKNVASVELVFDNSDHYLNVEYSEVSVKRRVYRSGENEYFINNNKCRLKDIINLFLDSGVGKESFNIISQGEVSKIISESNDDRRLVFEEAAGILKYKKRKEEALRKLDKTNDALDRVEDIISELEIQVKPLKEQSEKALEYKRLKEELETLEIALIAYDIYNLSTNEEILKKIDKLKHIIEKDQASGKAMQILNDFLDRVVIGRELNETFLDKIDSVMSTFSSKRYSYFSIRGETAGQEKIPLGKLRDVAGKTVKTVTEKICVSAQKEKDAGQEEEKEDLPENLPEQELEDHASSFSYLLDPSWEICSGKKGDAEIMWKKWREALNDCDSHSLLSVMNSIEKGKVNADHRLAEWMKFLEKSDVRIYEQGELIEVSVANRAYYINGGAFPDGTECRVRRHAWTLKGNRIQQGLLESAGFRKKESVEFREKERNGEL